MDTTEEAVQEAFNLLQLLAGVLVGAAITLLIAVVAWIALRIVSHRSNAFRLLLRRIKIPYFTLFVIAGAWVGLNYMAQVLNTETATWIPPLQHTLLIATIVLVGWVAYAAAFIIEDIPDQRHGEGGSRRLATQAQMLRRMVQLLVIMLAIVAVILTFPSARIAMGSILASAGVISLVAGIAAQDSLSNTFAGLQITFTDALRVGDVVVVDNQFGTIEEITLTYVVLRMWDERRMIVPSRQFTQNTFENWTRLHSKVAGTVELRLDWRAPVSLIRKEVDRLLMETDLWDGRTSAVQVTDSTDEWMLVRIAVSARNSGDLWDLRCYMRENLIEWVVTNAPYAIARSRFQREEVVEVEHDRSEQEIVALAEELREIEDLKHLDSTDQPEPPEQPEQPAETIEKARLRAARKRASKARRKKIKDRLANMPLKAGEDESTRVLSPEEIAALAYEPTPARSEDSSEAREESLGSAFGEDSSSSITKDGSEQESGGSSSNPSERPGGVPKRVSITQTHVSDRLYSGDKDADERSELMIGPGAQTQRQREQTQTLRALRLGEISPEVAVERLGGDAAAQDTVNAELRRMEKTQKSRRKTNE